ncbi:MAG: LacI family transcriptional regulator [Clostridiales bacterium]|nr:LacI family transcriptional regulator [Clostridiales bacterium]
MATLKDVAKLAAVDVSTVSRALNNTSYVHPETKKRILDAVEQLSYKPNLLAKGLRQGKRHTLGVVVPSITLTVFADITEEIEIEARKMGYGVMICNTGDNPATEEECLKRLRNGLVDGILIASTGHNQRLLRDIRAGGISVVQMVRKQDKVFPSVVADYYDSGLSGAKYLYGCGCRSIGFINGDMELIPYKERYRGYRRAMKELGLPEHMAKSSAPRGYYFHEGYHGIRELLDSAPDLDGVIVATDMQGVGAMRALKEKEIHVPEQIRLISLTGHSIGGMLETAITTMEMPAKEMGVRLVHMIVEEIEAEADTKPSLQHIVFDVALVERETT